VTGRLAVTADVAGLLGEDLDRLAARTAAEGYDCPVCGRHAELADSAAPPPVVVLAAGPDVRWARVAHPGCAEPGVLPVPAELPADLSMTVVAGIVPHASGPRAVVLAEPSATVTTLPAAPGGERTDAVAAWLLRLGLHLLGRAGQLAPPAPGWRLALPSPAAAVITGPGATVLYEGTMIRPAGWERVDAARGGAELLTGVSGVAGLGPHDSAAALLAGAARAGRLVGGTITVAV
jgi:hypothetical protein